MSEVSSATISRLRLAAQIARCTTVVLLLTMFVGTHIPANLTPVAAASDTLLHVAAYMALTISILASWELSAGLLQPQHYFVVWLVCTLYGAFDEITQIPVGRVCDGLDWLADIAGILIGLVLYRLFSPLLYRLL